ncbi:hypothetical protein KI387_007364, partial [Taxus chinensis]
MQLRPYMQDMVPLLGIFDPDFIAANQGERANNIIKGSKKEQVQQIIQDISDVIVGLNDTKGTLFASVEKNESEISPSTLYAIACLIDFAIEKNSLIGGDDFKSGQTKMKSMLVDFLVGAGIKESLQLVGAGIKVDKVDNQLLPEITMKHVYANGKSFLVGWGLIDFAIEKNSLIGGDDFKSGHTKMKSVLVDFLVGAGIKESLQLVGAGIKESLQLVGAGIKVDKVDNQLLPEITMKHPKITPEGRSFSSVVEELYPTSGYSIAKNDKNIPIDQNRVAEHLYNALKEFYSTNPEFKNRVLFVAGKSYVRKYVSSLAHYILMQSKMGPTENVESNPFGN